MYAGMSKKRINSIHEALAIVYLKTFSAVFRNSASVIPLDTHLDWKPWTEKVVLNSPNFLQSNRWQVIETFFVMESYKLDWKRERNTTRPPKDKPGGGTPVWEGWAADEIIQSAIWRLGTEMHAAEKTKGLSLC